MQHANAVPTSPDLINPALATAVAQVILRSLAKDPGARFASASRMTVALARALHTPIPERLSHLASVVENEEHARASIKGSPFTPLPAMSSAAFLHGHAGSSLSSLQQTADGVGRADLQGAPGIPSFSPASRVKRRKQQRVFVFLTALLLLTSIVAGGGLATLLQRKAAPASPTAVGHAFFLSSGQIQENTNPQGINDELQIDLSGIPDPGPGYSYYAWLLPDTIQTEAPPIFLGTLPVKNGSVHFLYLGGQSHINLLAVTSRFLITRQASSVLPIAPPPVGDQWRYYAEIPQAASPTDKLQFSMLDHFRHLLVESPELTVREMTRVTVIGKPPTISSVSEATQCQGTGGSVHEQTMRSACIVVFKSLQIVSMSF
jgi:hypothetical protein